MPKLSLILMRHGEAAPNGANDHSRELTQTGRTKSNEAGLELRSLMESCSRAIVSDAARTRQSAEQIFMNYPATVVGYEPKIYLADSTTTLVAAISRHLDQSDKAILVVGHNPSISEAASELSGVMFGFCPSEYVVLTIESEDWSTALQSMGCWAPVDFQSRSISS